MRLVAAVLAVSLSMSHALAATPDDAASRAREAVQQGDWPQAIGGWQQLYLNGDREASGQLCALYFDGRQGSFDSSRVIDWCRRAAARGDAGSLYRMGLLYLVGLGVERNVDQAQALCAAAVGRGPEVPAGFCLAVARKEREEAAREALLPAQVRAPAAAQITLNGTPAQNCDRAFTATAVDAAAASRWCRKAAADGDPEALYRLGLMQLMGLGEKRDLDLAEADCVRAGALGTPHPPTAFCIAAVAQLRAAAASLAISRDTGAIDADPTVGRALPTGANPYAVDSVLDAPRTTPTGLTFNCRQITQWALFEAPGLTILTPRDTLFGRRITAYKPADFAALNHAAETCTKLTAPVDPQGSLARNFATFRTSIRALQVRQAQLRNEQRLGRDEAARIAAVNQANRTNPVVMSLSSTEESACVERVRERWQAMSQNNRPRALEIHDSNRAVENGGYFVYGVANVVATDTAQREVVSVSMFRCIFDKKTDRITKFQLLPGFSSAE